jgi:hypothetical protein
MAMTMTMNRRASIERAFDKASQTRPGPPVQKGMTRLQIAGEVARVEHEPDVGGMTRLLHALSPEEQRQIREVANLYANARDMGRHGHGVRKDLLDAFDLPADLAEAVINGLEVDYVAAELQRRRGSDADRPLPALTRRDYIGAAIDAHSPVPARKPPKLNEATREQDAYYKAVVDPALNEGETKTETENQRGHLRRWGSRRKAVEDAYNLHDKLNDVRQGDTAAQQEAERGKLRRWGSGER